MAAMKKCHTPLIYNSTVWIAGVLFHRKTEDSIAHTQCVRAGRDLWRALISLVTPRLHKRGHSRLTLHRERVCGCFALQSLWGETKHLFMSDSGPKEIIWGNVKNQSNVYVCDHTHAYLIRMLSLNSCRFYTSHFPHPNLVGIENDILRPLP